MARSSAYKISLVITNSPEPGAIVDVGAAPRVGDQIRHDGRLYEITELVELMPARDDFGYLHATCRRVDNA